MIFLISWRNIWRNKKRSLIIIMAISFGIWAGAFSVSIYDAMINEMLRTSIDYKISHLQFHHPKYSEENHIKYSIENEKISDVFEHLRLQHPNAKMTKRFRVNGMIASPKSARGVQIIGVDPDSEKDIYKFYQSIVEGDFFENTKRNPVVISTFLAKKLNVKLKSKVVLSFQNEKGDIESAAFRVIGIYKSPILTVDEVQLFVKNADIEKILNKSIIHEISVLTDNIEMTKAFAEEYSNQFPKLDVKDWKALDPQIRVTVESSKQSSYIIIAIIMIALMFGITNTMLMSVFERIKEFGVLIAVGMKHFKLFQMIVTETLYLSLIAALIGLLAALSSIQYFATYGLDLSVVSVGLENFGVSHILYTKFDLNLMIQMLLFTISTAVISASYPAIKAVKLNVVDAIHHQ